MTEIVPSRDAAYDYDLDRSARSLRSLDSGPAAGGGE